MQNNNKRKKYAILINEDLPFYGAGKLNIW